MKYHEVSFKQSHNSYERKEDPHVTLTFHSQDPGNAGGRGLEYDIWRHSDATGGKSVGYFTVAHTIPGETPFATYLGYLLSWHLAEPKHDVIFVTVDIKSKKGDERVFPDEIDKYLGEWFKEELMYKPGDLFPKDTEDKKFNENFVAYIKENGWPEVENLQGKFIFCLSGNEDWKSHYAMTEPRKRPCFADADFDDNKPATVPTSGQRIIYSSNLFSDNAGTWQKRIKALRAANLITRGYVLNGSGLWDKAKVGKLNLCATDKITGHDWAHVGDAPFVAL